MARKLELVVRVLWNICAFGAIYTAVGNLSIVSGYAGKHKRV